MKTSETRKKVPLQSLPTNSLTEIEEKVDEIINAHSEVLRRGRESSRHGFGLNSSITPEKRPSLFFLKSKKHIESSNTEKKPYALKTKKRIGFGKRPEKSIPQQTKTVRPEVKHHGEGIQKKRHLLSAKTSAKEKTTERSSEDIPHFQESISQIKPDEASWIDQQIKANGTKNHDAPFNENIHKKIDEPQAKTDHQNIQEIVTQETISNDTTQKPDNFSSFEAPDQSQGQKKSTLDEITPDGQIQYVNEANALKVSTLHQLGYVENQIEEIDFYPLHEPFAYVEIIREKESLDKRYVLIEMQLTEQEARLLKFMKETLSGFAFDTMELEKKGESQYLAEKVDQIIDEYMLNNDAQTKKKIMYYLEKEFLGLGKLEVLMKDTNIEDISCDGSGVSIFLYHRRFGSLKSNVQFVDEDELSAFVVKLAQKCGKHISISEPMLDATMPDGSRIQMTLSAEVTTKGSTFTIRKFSEDPFSPPDLVEFNTMSSEMVAYMWLAVENGVNALIAGGTAAGKTSTMNAISLFIPRESKIVSIEETREINLPHPNWIPGVVRSGFGEVVGNKVIGEIDLYDLMKAALRQRPEYILVGEIRGKEAYVLFQAMATGHTTYSTVHADSAQSLIHRLEGKPIEIPRIMLQALDIVCIQVISRVKDKRARRCKQIIEIIDIDPATKEILTNEVFHWDPIEDKFIYSGKSYILERIRAEKDISREAMISEIKNRASLIEWMNKNNIREFKKVATVIAQYADNPTDVMQKIKNEL
jgi:flagellar protein FlaI